VLCASGVAVSAARPALRIKRADDATRQDGAAVFIKAAQKLGRLYVKNQQYVSK